MILPKSFDKVGFGTFVIYACAHKKGRDLGADFLVKPKV